MSLSASTLVLFVLLVPGFVFRFCLFHGSIVKRPFYTSGSIYASITMVMFAIFIHVSVFVTLRLALFIAENWFSYSLDFGIVEFNGSIYLFYKKARYEVISFISRFPVVSSIYFFVIIISGYIAASIIRYIANKTGLFSSILYGPLAPILASKKEVALICFVLSRVSHENRQVIYMGVPSEISFKDGSNVDHIVIEDPAKFYLRKNRQNLSTSFDDIEPLSGQAAAQSYLYISGTEIVVGVARFELTTPCSRSRCATRLRYTPILLMRAGL
jgi:hypothetical protein